MTLPLFLPSHLAAALHQAWVEGRNARAEPCGYLVGDAVRGDGERVHAVEIGTNVHPSPARGFALAPDEHLAVRREARARGWRVIGCWHGHLVGPPVPGRADAEGLGPVGPDLALIVGPEAGHAADDPPRLRAWRQIGDRVSGEIAWNEVPIRVV